MDKLNLDRAPQDINEEEFQLACPSSHKSSHEIGGRGREVGGPNPPQGVLPQNWGETDLNHSVTCMVLKATVNDRGHLALCHDEFRGP
ncbi:hypothetical protein TNCV_81 [Trichonephila clavipes]|nr:hypothetical protein TNCV_81 [Trichonephila clavipes]